METDAETEASRQPSESGDEGDFIPLELEGFENREVKLRIPGWFRGAALFVDGQQCESEGWFGHQFTVRDDMGRERTVEFKQSLGTLVDRIPQVKVGDEVYDVVDRLPWYQYVWAGLPVLLVFTGGAVGVLVGIVACRMNVTQLRKQSGFAAYGLTGLVTLASVVTWVVLVGTANIGIRMLFGS